MKLGTYTCDSCGILKREVNCWWLLSTSASGVLKVQPWDELEATMPDVQHFCGVEHLGRGIAKWTETAISNQELERMMR